MSFSVPMSKELIEEIACCIVDCNLNRDEASEYAWNVCLESVGVDTESVTVELSGIPGQLEDA